MNEQNIKFLSDRMVNDNVIEIFLGTIILEDEELLAIHCIRKDFKNDEGVLDFNDDVLLLTDKRIIKLNINSSLITSESYSLKLIDGFKMVKTYVPKAESIRSINFIEKITIFLRNKINNNDYLEIEFDEENKRLSLELQKRNASEFIEALTKLL